MSLEEALPEGVDPIDFPTVARSLVLNKVLENDPRLTMRDVYVVWFSFVMGGWKALVSTTLYDARYYEVTYNPTTKVVYVDVYVKHEQFVVYTN